MGVCVERYKLSKGVLIMLMIFAVIFIGFWIADRIEKKLGRKVDTITGWA